MRNVEPRIAMNREDLLARYGSTDNNISAILYHFNTFTCRSPFLFPRATTFPRVQWIRFYSSPSYSLCSPLITSSDSPLFWNSQCQSLASCPRKCEFIRQRPCQISSVSKSSSWRYHSCQHPFCPSRLFFRSNRNKCDSQCN